MPQEPQARSAPHEVAGSPASLARRPVRGLGPFASTALVAGSMIGSGIFGISGSLAEKTGPVAVFAWVAVALGFLALTAVFADLGGAYPSSGGPTTFVALAFGDRAGLVVAWLYWSCIVIGNAAFLTLFVPYLAVFVPGVDAPLPAFLVAQVLLWSLTAVNAAGVRAGGAVQTVTTVLKILPLLVLAVALLPLADAANLRPFAPHGAGALVPALSLIAWLFVGSETVTVTGAEVEGGGAAIRRAAYAGFALATGVFLLVSVTVSLALPQAALAGRADSLAVAAAHALGTPGAHLISAGALISIAGALNGWLLVAARVPLAAAEQGYGPAWLGARNGRTGVPLRALLVSSAITGSLASLYFVHSLLRAYELVTLLATATSLVAVGAACLALVALVRRDPGRFTVAQRRRAVPTAVLGVSVVALMIAGSGLVVVLLTLACALAPLPFFRRRPPRASGAHS